MALDLDLASSSLHRWIGDPTVDHRCIFGMDNVGFAPVLGFAPF